ncbi:MAG: hypothetical protein VXY17_02435, partial [Verrucomicrobiota bacterium]|nr:hypothetical protein [Verrucomicrobiota bacterium]
NDYTNEVLSLYYSSMYYDPLLTGLEVFYSNNYQMDPSSANWEEFFNANSELNSNKSTGNTQTDYYNLQVDLSEIEGTSITVGIKYTSIDQDPNSARAWAVANPTITATETINTTVEGNGEAVSFYRLRVENLGF